MNIKIRNATTDDNVILSELGKRTFYDTWRPVNTEEDMQSYMKAAFDPMKLKSDLENSVTNTFLLAFNEESIVGYVKMRRDRSYDEFKGETAIEIERIYVLKDYLGKKVGKSLMDESLKLAKEEGFKWLWLGVNIDNHKAIDFYKSYGFTIFGEKSFQLGEAMDNDYLMKMNLRI